MPDIFVQFLTEHGISPYIFIKISKTKFYGDPSAGDCAKIDGQTDEHGEANRRYFTRLRQIAKVTISVVMHVRLSVRVEQLGSHWTDFDKT